VESEDGKLRGENEARDEGSTRGFLVKELGEEGLEKKEALG